MKGKKCGWLNADIKNEMNTRDHLHRKAQNSKKHGDWSLFKKQRNKCNNLIRKAKANYHRNLIDENITNPRKFWACIKAVFPSKSRPVQGATNKDELNSTVKSFSEYFSNVVKLLKSTSSPLTNFIWRYIDTLPKRTNKKFTFSYVSRVFGLKELRALSRQKATGIDELPPGMLKDCADVIAGPLTHIVNLSIQTSTVP